jgi:hypothetical protein
MPRVRTYAAVIPCSLQSTTKEAINRYTEALKHAAPEVGNLRMSDEEFWDSGVFHAAVERLRGQQAASMATKRQFISEVLDHLQKQGRIAKWISAGGGDRHDYEVTMPDQTVTAIEAKGCLDGNNTNIFQRPPNADEFLIWSLCQNPGADPRHNAWSGIHTRLSAEIMHRRQLVDGLIIWDMVCGTVGRLCPKVNGGRRPTAIGRRKVPPPCIYLFPRSVPDPRNNPNPRCWKLKDIKFLNALHAAFGGDANDVTEVRIVADVEGASVRRKTTLVRNGEEVVASQPTALRRANS